MKLSKPHRCRCRCRSTYPTEIPVKETLPPTQLTQPRKAGYSPDTKLEVTYMLVNVDDDKEYSGTILLNVFDATVDLPGIQIFKYNFTLSRYDDPKIVSFNLPNMIKTMVEPTYYVTVAENFKSETRLFKDTEDVETFTPTGGIMKRTIYIEPIK